MGKLIAVFGALFGGVILFILMVAVFALLLSIPLWLVWNWVAVAVLGMKTITLLQALGLALLSGLLFGRSVTKS